MAHILVIDDSISMIAFLEHTLVGAGYEVTTAANGKLGLEHMQSRRFDLVITDLFMPESDGIETIRGAREANLVARIIAISSKDSIVNLLPAARMLGAVRTLQKPFTASQLLENVAVVLSLPEFPVAPAPGGARHEPGTPPRPI